MNTDTCAEELDVALGIIEVMRREADKRQETNRKLLRMVIERDQRIADLEKQLSVSQPATDVRLPAMVLGAWEI